MANLGATMSRACAVLALVIAMATAAAAQSKCDAAKAKAAATAVATEMKCYAKALKKGNSVDAGCLGDAITKMNDKYTKAESRGDCSTPGDSSNAGASIDAFVSGFFAGSGGGQEMTCCADSSVGFCYAVTGLGFLDCQDALGSDGVNGAIGSGCDASTGTCNNASHAGNCCSFSSDGYCVAGPSLVQQDCEDAGGTFVANSTCESGGSCTP